MRRQHERFAYLDPVIVELPEQPPVPSLQVHFGNADQSLPAGNPCSAKHGPLIPNASSVEGANEGHGFRNPWNSFYARLAQQEMARECLLGR